MRVFSCRASRVGRRVLCTAVRAGPVPAPRNGETPGPATPCGFSYVSTMPLYARGARIGVFGSLETTCNAHPTRPVQSGCGTPSGAPVRRPICPDLDRAHTGAGMILRRHATNPNYIAIYSYSCYFGVAGSLWVILVCLRRRPIGQLAGPRVKSRSAARAQRPSDAVRRSRDGQRTASGPF